MYKTFYSQLSGQVHVFRESDGAFIPCSMENPDFREFKKWQDKQPEDKKLDLSPRQNQRSLEKKPTLFQRFRRLFS